MGLTRGNRTGTFFTDTGKVPKPRYGRTKSSRTERKVSGAVSGVATSSKRRFERARLSGAQDGGRVYFIVLNRRRGSTDYFADDVAPSTRN